MTEDEMVGWMASPIEGLEFGQAPGVGDGQGSLACCGPWGHKQLDMTEQLTHTHTHTQNKQTKKQTKNTLMFKYYCLNKIFYLNYPLYFIYYNLTFNKTVSIMIQLTINSVIGLIVCKFRMNSPFKPILLQND